MTEVADPAVSDGSTAADPRVQRALALRQRQLDRAAVAQAAPDASPRERVALLDLMSSPQQDNPTDHPLPAGAFGTGRRRLPWRRSKTPSDCRGATTVKAAAPAVPADLVTIPPPGRAPRSIGRNRSWVTRALVVSAPLMLIGGIAYNSGVSTGSARVVAPAVLNPAEADRFHLSTFPAEQASGFAAAYLSLCLTHPDPADKTAVGNRLAGLAQMASAGVAPGCGWTGTTSSPAPLAVTWDGTAQEIPAYTTGAAAALGFTVTTVDGRTVGASVPVWVSAPDTAQAMRVVGDVTILPAVLATPAPTPLAPDVTDASLATTLTSTVLLPFLRAWGASDAVQLGLVLAPSASTTARVGLGDQLRDPRIDAVQAVVVTGTPAAYTDGDQVTAAVTVDWTTRDGQGTQRTGYSVDLQRVSGRWQVTAITAAAPDPAGGLAADATFPTTATPTPTAPASAGAAG